MLSEHDLKTWLHKNLSQKDKLLLILATISKPCTVAEIKIHAAGAGLKIGKSWNPSSILTRSKGLAIRVPAGWEITDPGRQHLLNLRVTSLSPAALQVASDLRAHLVKISNVNTRTFVEEAIKCHEAQLHRSAVVMSWLAAVAVLQKHVVDHHLAVFNAEALKVDPKLKTAITADDIGTMNEAKFLDRIAAISMIGKNAKEELQKALKLGNGCGHPNSLKIGPNAVANHIEILLLNVFDAFPS